MSRLWITQADKALDTVNGLYGDMSRRFLAAPEGNCPVDVTCAFLRMCLAQSCGKCAPCRIGLDSLASLIDKVLDGKAALKDLDLIERAARTIADSADCAIGFEAAKLVLDGFAAFKDDYVSHVEKGVCTANFKAVPCVENCPAHVDVPGYVALVAEGRYADAVRLIRKDNPFPSVCGLICEHPCEHHCRRSLVDAAVNIRGIKRVAVDNAGPVPAPKAAAATGKRVAVVGGGPAGLTAAYFLSLMGHKATVFEKRNRLGGMLRYGIPCYRLPDSYLDYDIDAILSLGVEVKTGVDIGKDITMDQLKRQYDAVYVSVGAHSDRKLGIDGEDKRGVISAVDLLRSIGDGSRPDFTGKNVVVVGGGNVAMDVTRTSMRLGAKGVTCVYRRRIDDMTALREEIDGAMAEGCEIMQLMSPVRVEYDADENVTALIGKPQIIGSYERGRPKPVDADAPETRIPCDIIIVAVGQAIDAKGLDVPTKREAVVTGKDLAVSGNVFAGGDCVSGPATVIRAIEAGKVAAANIDGFLGFHTEIGVDVEIPSATHAFRAATGRVNMAEREAGERKGDFELMEHCMSHEEAAQECARCLRCDHYGFGAFRRGRNFKW